MAESLSDSPAPSGPFQIGSEVPAPSSLLSSHWSQDNLVTPHPGVLYDGRVSERIDLERVAELVQELSARVGPIELGMVRLGSLTWDAVCSGAAGPFVLQLPLLLDEPGRRGRVHRDLPHHNFDNLRHFIGQGLTRFAVPPHEKLTLGGAVPAAMLGVLPDHYPLTFARGSLQVELAQGTLGWYIALGPERTAELLTEIIAALVYHYEPDLEGGTALADIFINDGDFVVRRRNDGAFALRLTAMRQRESGVPPSRLLLYLLQLLAFEEFDVDGESMGLPTLVSNPAVTFEGLSRGLNYRFRDLGRDEAAARELARRWIFEFGRSSEGRSYRPWVERYLDGRLPLRFGNDLRERWWRLIPIQTRLRILELRARCAPSPDAAASVRNVRTVLDRLCAEIGRASADHANLVEINDLDRDGILRLLMDAQIAPEERDRVAGELLAHWPYRNLDQLLAAVPQARRLRRLKGRISFGSVVAETDRGTLKPFGTIGRDGPDRSRPVANAELYGNRFLAESLAAAAVQAFPSFESYMDAVLQDERWGYYAHNVEIGEGGHFDTHPESLSPHYGRWLAKWAFSAWRDLLAQGVLSENDAFSVIEFGAGNGRLARDVSDAIRAMRTGPAQPERAAWERFAERASYRIYEKSAALRDKQRALVGPEVTVAEGDARHPQATLGRDFPNGVRGVVITNEVPDAFGAHKLLLTAEGRAFATLVLPRAEASVRALLDATLASRLEQSDKTVRERFDLRENAGDLYLDARTFGELMSAGSKLSNEQRDALVGSLWFEEAYVSAAAIPELAAHLRANAGEYAAALAAEDSGVVVYVNLHADRFVRELGAVVRSGFIVVVDYGGSTWELVQGARHGEFPFRVYGEWQDFVPRPNDPYSAPGRRDLTADVNFTDLARAAREIGLGLIHFGLERDVAGEELPACVDAATREQRFARFVGNSMFKVLVVGTHPSTAFTSRFPSALSLGCSEQDLPKPRRDSVNGILRQLSSYADDGVP